MRAVVITKHGDPGVLAVEQRPEPVVGAGQLRITVRAAGINFADLMARSGIYPDAPDPPCVVGYEVAGEVESVGEGVDGFAVGDRVLAGTRFGGYAELVTASAGDVVAIPDSLSFEQAAAVPVNYATAWAALVVMGGLAEGERVLIHAAAGGVGIAASQLARSIGAEIYGTASAAKHDAIRQHGVAHPIDYRSTDFAEEVRRLTDGQGVDVIIDAVGPTNYRKDYRLLRQGGRLVMFGLSEAQKGQTRDLRSIASALVKMPLATIPWWKSLAIMNENKGVFGLNMLTWWEREGLGRFLGPLSEGLADGRFVPVVDRSFPFEDATDAHRYIHEGRNVGKVVLTP